MRYIVRLNPKTQSLSIPELCVEADCGDMRKNMKTLRALVPPTAVLIYPYLGPGQHQPDWDEIGKETLTEPRMGQDNFHETVEETWESLGFSELELPEEIPEPIKGFGK